MHALSPCTGRRRTLSSPSDPVSIPSRITDRRSRRAGPPPWLALLVACALSLVATHASAGTYLDRAGLLLLEARAEGDMLRRRPSDKELAEAIVTLSEARLKVAEEIRVPESVAKAHPHLLLVLANANRAARAAVDGDMKKFVELSEATRAEAATYRALLQDAGYTLPDACPK